MYYFLYKYKYVFFSNLCCDIKNFNTKPVLFKNPILYLIRISFFETNPLKITHSHPFP